MQDNNKMDTLSERMNFLKKQGFKEEFKVEDGKLCTQDGRCDYLPNEITIVEHYRFEGQSDPGDMTVLYGIETKDGIKGVLVDGFGTYSSEGQSEFVKRIRELHKGEIY